MAETAKIRKALEHLRGNKRVSREELAELVCIDASELDRIDKLMRGVRKSEKVLTFHTPGGRMEYGLARNYAVIEPLRYHANTR